MSTAKAKQAMADGQKINVTFRALTRWSDAKATRRVRKFDSMDRPIVRFGGWSDFIVRQHEVISFEVV